MRFIYTFIIWFHHFLIYLASLFDTKAKKWIKGRKNLFKKIENAIQPDDHVIWMHAASLGEFEQGQPVLETIRKTYPTHKIILTFFSPSGYDIRKNYDQVDHVFYLPSDTFRNAKKFIKLIRPELAIFVKYEFWFNFLKVLQSNKCQTIFISSIFRKGQYFFKWYGGWFRKHLRGVDHYFVQNISSQQLLSHIGIQNVSVAGDSRFDRVYNLAKNCTKIPLAKKFKNNSPLLIAGSTWPPDEEIIFPLIEKMPNIKFIIAPHDVKDERIKQITKKLGDKAIRFSIAKNQKIDHYQVLIIDSIGLLAQLYQYANVCYIGGGFGVAIHNIQEPITFGKPVMFGPKFEKFQEAIDLIKRRGAFCVNNTNELELITNQLINDSELLQKTSDICIRYVDEMRGATSKIMKFLKDNSKF